MPSYTQQIIRLGNAVTSQEVWSLAEPYLARLGFPNIAYGVTYLGADLELSNRCELAYFSQHNTKGQAEPFDKSLHLRTATYRWLMANTGTISWGWSEQERAAGRLSADEEAAFDQASRKGYTAGYSMSFADPCPRRRPVLVLGAAETVTQSSVDALWARKGQDIYAYCLALHLKLHSLPSPAKPNPLSPRQRETLQWVAEGKTTADVATIMKVSPAMVEKHLRLAREALDVETTAHAVAKATLSNYLFPESILENHGDHSQ